MADLVHRLGEAVETGDRNCLFASNRHPTSKKEKPVSGELQRLSTQAEVSPLMRTHGGLVLSNEGRQLQAALRREAANGIVQKARIAIASDIAMDAMDSVKEVDDYRRTLAGNDQTLNALLVEVEMNHVHQVSRIQRGSAF
ncbi:hypothetical protein [Saccharothrix texasensis]|uniref:Uncharacterized protein n=1 Tax=Saccharothrix texasensis TaxID=103734 RepID=A0A3N1H8Y8_9PSEU|nr:hypothetical protein [Saccharothrix texasensis]ROP38989.1 hypothetical protein EDD40_4357 [Saccharothrix texasensis]